MARMRSSTHELRCNQQDPMAWKTPRRPVKAAAAEVCQNFPRATPTRYELLWRLRLAMSQRRHRPCGYFMMVGVTTRLPSTRSDVSAAAGPRLLIRQVQYLLISQLTFISEGSSPIRRLGTRLVVCSSASTVCNSQQGTVKPCLVDICAR